MRLVADIGGTNARLALAEHGVIVPSTARRFANNDWPNFYDMLTAYLKGQSPARLTDLVIAVAGPVNDGTATLTNRNWTISTAGLVDAAKCDTATLLNDLTALGFSVPALRPNQLEQYYTGETCRSDTKQSLVIGIGTGFNTSPTIMTKDAVQCLNVETGHVSLPLSISQMLNEQIGQTFSFSTVEELFSGRGFAAFCQQMCGDKTLSGIAAISSYGRSNSELISSVVDRYASMLGQLLRELSLAYMPNSGIYLAGSVARAIMKSAPLGCVTVYEEPCRIGSGKKPNLYLINDDCAALVGCAAF